MRAPQVLALAADLPLPQAQQLHALVAPYFGVVKVGLSLFVEHGPAAVAAFVSGGAQVFLDLKLHDIPNTVALAAERAGRLGASYLTVHAGGGREMMKAAVAGAAKGAASVSRVPPRILAVTVLTSHDEASLKELGVNVGLQAHVYRLAELAHAAGVGGVVCSPREARQMRALFGADATVCTPGIRPAGVAAGDQQRVETPSAAIAEGASLLVIGRPVYEAPSPVAAAKGIAEDVERALQA